MSLMTWKAFKTGVAAIGFSAAFAGGMHAASADAVLRYSPWLPAAYPLNDAVLRPFMAEVEKVTEGRVRFEWLPKAVGSAASQFDAVHDGLADMSLVLPGYTPGRFELMELGELPLLSSETAVVAPTFYDIYAEHIEPLNPFAGTHVVSLWSTIPTEVVSSKGLIKSLDDFKGQKLRAPSSTAVSIMEQVGAVPVQKPVSEIYELASSGIVDGSFFPISTNYDFKTADILNNFTLVPGGLGQSVMALLVNENKWNSIDEKDRQAIMDLAGAKMAKAAGELFGAKEAEAIAKKRDEDPDRIMEMSPQLTAELTERLKPVDQEWIDKAKAAGMEDPQAVLDQFRAELNKAEAAAK